MKMDVDTIKEKSPYILLILGVIPILLHALETFDQYKLLSKIGDLSRALDKSIFQGTFDELITSFTAATFGTLILSIVGFVLTLTLVGYFVKIVRDPSRNDFVAIGLLGLLGLLVSSGLGGILIIIAGIIGFRQYSTMKELKNMFKLETIRRKLPEILIIAGVIPIALFAWESFKKYAVLDTLGKATDIANELFFQDFFDPLLTKVARNAMGELMVAIAGLILTVVLIGYFVKIIKNPVKGDFVIVALLGIATLFVNSGLGGVLIIIAGIIGFRRYSK